MGETERFLAKVDQSGECWLWTATKHVFGYGSFGHKGKKVGAHRMSYELFVGPIPEGMFVLHRCDVPECVKPDHLFLGDQKANLADMTKKGRRRNQNNGKTHCVHGHALSGYNLVIQKDGKRNCRECGNEAARQYRRRVKTSAK